MNTRFTLIVLTVLSLFMGLNAHAVSESELSTAWSQKISPFFDAGVGGEVLGAGRVHLRTRVFKADDARGTVIVATGFSENLHKYAEVAYDLVQAHFNVVLYDHRGQGYSGRLVDDPHKGHLDDFDNLARDLGTVIHSGAPADMKGPKFVLAHSMGGAAAIRQLQLDPGDLKAVAVTAPMLKIDLHHLPLPIVQIALKVLIWGLGDQLYVTDHIDPVNRLFADNHVTGSANRFEILNHTLLVKEPQLGIWGVTAGWLKQSLLGVEKIQHETKPIITPLLIFQADHDDFVLPEGESELCARAPNCTLQFVPGSKHELLMETDAIRNAVLMQSIAFFVKSADHSVNKK